MIGFFLVVCIIMATILSILLTDNKQTVPDTYTTFLGSNYSTLIKGELNKAHVLEAEAAIGTIKGVQIGTLVTSIGNENDTVDTAPFAGKNSIKSVIFKEGSNCKLIGVHAFNGTGITSLVIPNGVTSIEGSAYINCTSLISLVIPNSVTSIGENSFLGCTSLTSVTFPNGLESIGEGSFFGCTSLTSVTFPNTLNSIGEYAFVNCPRTYVQFTGSGVHYAVTVGFTTFSSPPSLTVFEWYLLIQPGGNIYE